MTFVRLNTRDICIVLFSTTTETATPMSTTTTTTTEQVIQDTKICEEMFPGKKRKLKISPQLVSPEKKSGSCCLFVLDPTGASLSWLRFLLASVSSILCSILCVSYSRLLHLPRNIILEIDLAF